MRLARKSAVRSSTVDHAVDPIRTGSAMKHPAFQARFSVLAVAFAATLPVFAQSVAPDAGQTLREMQQQPAPALPRSVPSLVVPADADTQADPGQTFPVTAVRIEGNVGIATSELQPLVDSVVGREASLGELRQAASRITALYRERGYFVARGFLPAQKIEDGIVLITVLEGRLQS
ncbi:MAG: fhaC2, partial [Rhizobacter sp.]|nr:fhaC2 [Rhizobacter sp.]